MSKSLEFLFVLIDDSKLNSIIDGCIQYPKTEDHNDDKPFITMQFNPNNLTELNPDLITNIELKHFKLNEDVIFLINSINKFRHNLLVAKADHIIITRNTFVLAKLENELKPNSGRSIKIDLNSFRNNIEYISNEILNKRMTFGAIIGISLIIAWKIYN